MSAWTVSGTHIDVLVCGAMKYGVPFGGELVTSENADAVGQALLHENYRSVNHLYDDDEPTPIYKFRGEANVKPIVLFKQASCYGYQSCEHPGYARSKARKFIRLLEEAILLELGLERNAAKALPEYDAAPWGM